MLWQEFKTEQIIGGTTPDGVRYLKLFLADYARLFKTNNLCASCNNLIAEYHKKYISKIMEKDNTSKYRLHEKYNGIQLEPCSSVFVTNGNITDELGSMLLANKGSRIFSKFPSSDEQNSIVEQTTVKFKKRRTKKQ
jgi:DNA-directed RNA polymerase subunit N (RpoN/RPB10)